MKKSAQHLIAEVPQRQSQCATTIGYPDHRPTQHIGTVPDVVARPTIQGITAGRDEVLETAVHLLEDAK